MNFINENFKFPGMKKEDEFTIYPVKENENKVILQSDTRIMRVDLTTGHAILSARKANGAHFVHLSPIAGAYEIELTAPQLILIQSMKERVSKKTNKDGSFNLIGKKEEVKEDVNFLLEIKEDFKTAPTDLELVREEVYSSYTLEEIAGFKSFDEFFAEVDVQNFYEDEWAKNKNRYKICYRVIYNEILSKLNKSEV